LLSIAGHKFYAPKGVGVLYVRSGVKLDKFIHGADHELNRRAGTENVLEIVGLGKASELVKKNLAKYIKNMQLTRNTLKKTLIKLFPKSIVNGNEVHKLPNTLSLSFEGIEANTIVSELKTIAVSAGAACHGDSVDISLTLKAMKIPVEYAMGTIRFSTGRYTNQQEINYAVKEIKKVVNRLQPKAKKSAALLKQSEIKLTQYTHGMGCACKLRPQLLEEVLNKMPVTKDKKVLVGINSSDDAAVYKLDDKFSIVQTVDFFTPVVDDPFQFGAIAAANSLSDIYAMGAKPLFALNVVGFPSNRLPIEVLEKILEGANSKAKEAGISIIGGHTVEDVEPKFGLAITGIIENRNVITNSNSKSGDVLILTKPIGTGIYSTALKKGILDKKDKKLLIDTMSELNKAAAEAMNKVGVNSCTDVTGFGLLGHLLEMMKASKTTAVVEFNKVKFLPGILELAVAGNIPGGTKENFTFTSPYVDYDKKISDTKKIMLNDSQTSGGLLISVSKRKSKILINLLLKSGIKTSHKIGEVIPANKHIIQII